MVPLLQNRTARHEYAILHEIEAGLVLSGAEVKSLRAKRGNITQSFIKVIGNEAHLVNARIEPYAPSATTSRDSDDLTKSRKLLLHKSEIAKLSDELHTKGLTAIPMMIGIKGNFIKVLIGVGKGKKQYERKEEIKKRDLARDEARELRAKKV